MKRYILLGMLPVVCSGFGYTPSAAAQTYEPYQRMSFSLDVERRRFELDVEDTDHDSANNTLGISLYQHGTRNPVMGFQLGYSHFTIQDHPLTDGVKLGGYYAGLALYNADNQRPVQLLYSARYRYHAADESVGEQNLDLELHDWRLRMGGRVAVAPNWNVIASVVYGGQEGVLLARGPVRDTLDLQRPAATWLQAAIRYQVDHSGYVMLSGSGGPVRGLEISFWRDFF